MQYNDYDHDTELQAMGKIANMHRETLLTKSLLMYICNIFLHSCIV